jgi:hypothetical protein
MLAARAAAEIVAGDEDLRLAIGGLLRTKSGFSEPSGVAHLREQAGARPVRLIVLR